MGNENSRGIQTEVTWSPNGRAQLTETACFDFRESRGPVVWGEEASDKGDRQNSNKSSWEQESRRSSWQQETGASNWREETRTDMWGTRQDTRTDLWSTQKKEDTGSRFGDYGGGMGGSDMGWGVNSRSDQHSSWKMNGSKSNRDSNSSRDSNFSTDG